jgi:hypothetical protein
MGTEKEKNGTNVERGVDHVAFLDNPQKEPF